MWKLTCLILGTILLGAKSSSPDELLTVAENLLNNLKTVVENSISTNLPELNLLPAELEALSNAVSAPALQEIASTMAVLRREVADLRAEAEDLGYIDMEQLENCIKSFQWELDLLSRYVANEITGCLNLTVNQGQYIIQVTSEIILNTRNSVERLSLEVDRCKLTPSEQQEECIIRVIEAIAVETVDLPATISEETTKAQAVVQALEGTLYSCASDRIGAVPVLGRQVIGYMRNCAKLPTQ